MHYAVESSWKDEDGEKMEFCTENNEHAYHIHGSFYENAN